ncbi:MAG: ABC transporter ATP-binding protein [Bacteroidales bacterium]|nr:ABC transporter ATP-binding protein [Bacteroidales bacterium]
MNEIIRCENISQYYGDKLVYKNINFGVEEGKILGLLGKNGTGKTTIINILNGYLTPTEGRCTIFGHDVRNLTPNDKARIGLLLEGHVQYTFFNVNQIERFYSRFYPNWNADAYYDLIKQLHISEHQRIASMSCGQRSQVALGLIFAQNPEVLILDDFSMGLDPGYRRLFIERLLEFVRNGKKTVFLTSHIIQDMEMLIDDCMVFDYGRVLLHKPTAEIMNTFRRYTFDSECDAIPHIVGLWHTARVGKQWETYSFLSEDMVHSLLEEYAARNIVCHSNLSLEDAFIGLTGKY